MKELSAKCWDYLKRLAKAFHDLAQASQDVLAIAGLLILIWQLLRAFGLLP